MIVVSHWITFLVVALDRRNQVFWALCRFSVDLKGRIREQQYCFGGQGNACRLPSLLDCSSLE